MTIKGLTKRTISPIRWLVWVAVSIAACVAALAACVYIVDPFMYYRTPASYAYYDARYCLAGLLKNEKYDTVIVGSSMMQNTRLESLQQAGWSPIKATCSGACPGDIKFLLDYAIAHGRPKRVIIGVDSFTFTYPPAYERAEMPKYLYDDNVWNDGKYWFDNKIWMNIFPGILSAGTKPSKLDLATVDSWADKFVFSKEAMLKTIDLKGLDKPPSIASSLDQMKVTYDETIYKVAAQNPDVDFYLLYPPYSIFAWYGRANEIKLQDNLSFKEYIIFKKLPNIRVFDFQDQADIVLNLDNYKDYTHYRPEVNDMMMEYLVTGKSEVTSIVDQRARNSALLDVVNSWTGIK